MPFRTVLAADIMAKAAEILINADDIMTNADNNLTNADDIVTSATDILADAADVISKPHAYLQSMFKSLVKFQMNRHKTVGGVAHTRYSLSIHFDSRNAKIVEKETKK